MRALGKAGIAAKDIQTSNLNLSAQYQYAENQPPKLTGYQVSNQVTVRVLDLTRLGPAVDAVVASGANQVNGISFGLNDPTAAENAARQDAVRALTEKADLYAKATGYRVNRLVSLSDFVSGQAVRQNAADIVVYKSVGSALQDVVTAEMLLARAREQGVGTPLAHSIVPVSK